MFSIGDIPFGGGHPLVLIAGPCVVEGREMVLKTAERVRKVAVRHHVRVVFKASYKKANRMSGGSFSGIGTEKALTILAEVKRDLGLPILTDIHSEPEIDAAAEVADILQIPAFLCRQTDLLQAAGRTGKGVNIKKGQFMAPQDMEHQVEKIVAVGNKKVLVTERGSTFGYHNLVVDMRSLVIIRRSGVPVILDATHSVQLPGGEKTRSGGEPEFIAPIARAGAAVGIDGLFLEVHPDPRRALSDAGSQLKLELLDGLLRQVMEIDSFIKKNVAR